MCKQRLHSFIVYGAFTIKRIGIFQRTKDGFGLYVGKLFINIQGQLLSCKMEWFPLLLHSSKPASLFSGYTQLVTGIQSTTPEKPTAKSAAPNAITLVASGTSSFQCVSFRLPGRLFSSTCKTICDNLVMYRGGYNKFNRCLIRKMIVTG